jgi:AcrR family transcriptional regulator
MAPRRYRIDGRRKAMEETRRRIVEAAAALHAEQGVFATTYAQIAGRADVAVPTVYKYFPDLTALVSACTSHVGELSPAPGPEIFAAASGIEARIRALVAAVFALHRFQAPWMRHGLREAESLPVLAEVMAQGRNRLRSLIALALAPRYGDAPPRALVALFETLLDFAGWQRLAESLPQAALDTVTGDALLALARAEMRKTPPERSLKERRRRS